jgi:MFS family permease
VKLLRQRDFRLLYAGQAISVVGDSLFFVALPFAVLDDLNGSASDVGLVLAAQTLPFAVFVLAAGVWADRLPRQKLIITSDIVRALVQGVAAALLISGSAELWHLVVLVAIYGSADALFAPALGGLLPALVAKEDLHQANALLSISRRTAFVLGPSLAGVLIVTVGPGSAIAIDAVSFTVSVALIARIAVDRAPPPEQRARFWADLKGGVAEVLERPWLATFFPVFSAYHLIALPCVFALGPVLANRELDGAASWAIITTVFGIGTVAGGFVALRFKPTRPGLAIAICFLVASTQALIIANAGSTAAIAAFQGLAGIAVSYGFTVWDASIQRQIPAHAVSRVTSLDYFASVGTMPIGYALIGPVADAAGLHATMTGASLIVAGLCLAALLRRAIYESVAS